MAFYELRHRLDAEYFVWERGVDFSYPLHIHRCFEYILVEEGEMEVCIDQINYRLREGESVLIFPNQVHRLLTKEHSRHILCIFAPELIHQYDNKYRSLLPLNSRIKPLSPVMRALIHGAQNSDSLYITKGILYLICGFFDPDAVMQPRSAAGSQKNNLLFSVFDYIHAHYQENCSLHTLAAALKYDYAYLSRFFKSNVGIPFNKYLNQLRISEASYLLHNTDCSISEIGEKCGFQSIRSFNRNFHSCMGISPNEYRQKEPPVVL